MNEMHGAHHKEQMPTVKISIIINIRKFFSGGLSEGAEMDPTLLPFPSPYSPMNHMDHPSPKKLES